jgi:hypothetical protein
LVLVLETPVEVDVVVTLVLLGEFLAPLLLLLLPIPAVLKLLRLLVGMRDGGD